MSHLSLYNVLPDEIDVFGQNNDKAFWSYSSEQLIFLEFVQLTHKN